jgi:hypothetical protein
MRKRVPALLLLASLAWAQSEEPKEGDPPAKPKEGVSPAKPKEDTPPAKPKVEEKTIPLAVIVHPKNPVTKISFSELRSYFKMEQQFWPNRKRCVIYLPPRKTVANEVLLKKVYKMSARKLQQYWVRKLFSGEIPAKPSYVPSAKAAGSRVSREVGAISVVPADQVPKKVKVLLIDGKKPGDEGYKLVGKKKKPAPGAS